MTGPARFAFWQTLVFAAVLSGFLYGYNAGVYSGVMLQIKQAFSLSSAALGHLIAIFDFAEILGVCLTPLADRIGRRRVLMISALILLLAPLTLLADPPYWMILIERGVSGCAAGLTFMVGLVYVAEIAPAKRRALLLSSLMIGLSAGYVAELGLSILFVTGEGWHYVIAIASVPAAIQLIGLTFMKESPAFLRLHGLTASAETSAQWYGHPLDTDNAEQAEAITSIRGMLEAFRDPKALRGLMLGSVIVLAGAVNGTALVLSFGPLLMQRFGVTDTALALEILMIYMILGFGVGLLALIPIARGLTPHILVGSLIAIGSCLLLMSFASGNWAIGLVGAAQIAFSFGIRTTVFQLLPGFLSDQTRATGMALFNLCYIFFTGVNHEIIPRLLEALPSGVFVIYGSIAISLAVASGWVLWSRQRRLNAEEKAAGS